MPIDVFLPPTTGESPNRTTGSYATEADSAADFDRRVCESGAFRSYPEITGLVFQPRLLAEVQDVRIDCILTPTKKLIGAGWSLGPIGVELKKSGEKIGPVLSQAIDYSRAVWPVVNGFCCVLQWVCVWPFGRAFGPTASIMAQQRIGSVEGSHWNPLKFMDGSRNIIIFDRDWNVTVNQLRSGWKTGRR